MKEKNMFKLSHPQKRVWLTEKTYMSTPYFNIVFLVKLPQEIDKEILEKAVNLVLLKNDSLRLRFVEDIQSETNEPYQYISEYCEYELEEITFTGDDADSQAKKWCDNKTKEVYNLIDSPLYDFALVRTPQKNILLTKAHHLVSDGWSSSLIINDINNYYNELKGGGVVGTEPNPSYFEFISEEDEYLESGQAGIDKKFWLDKFSPLPEIANLSFRKTSSDSIAAEKQLISVPSDLRESMHKFAEDNGTTIYRLVVSAFAIYMSRLSRNPDVVIGGVNHNRTTSKLKKMTGMFVSTFYLRLNLNDNLDFASFVKLVGNELKDIIKNHERYPYDVLVKDLREVHQTGIEPLSMVNIVGHGQSYSEFLPEYQDTGCEPTPFNIHVNLNGKDSIGILELLFDYQTELFTKEEVRNIYNCLCNILHNGINNPDAKISQIRMTSDSDINKILYEFNKTEAGFPKDKTIHELFEEQVGRTPENKAVVFNNKYLTYKELNRKAR